jgi:hypothetical protein
MLERAGCDPQVIDRHWFACPAKVVIDEGIALRGPLIHQRNPDARLVYEVPEETLVFTRPSTFLEAGEEFTEYRCVEPDLGRFPPDAEPERSRPRRRNRPRCREEADSLPHLRLDVALLPKDLVELGGFFLAPDTEEPVEILVEAALSLPPSPLPIASARSLATVRLRLSPSFRALARIAWATSGGKLRTVMAFIASPLHHALHHCEAEQDACNSQHRRPLRTSSASSEMRSPDPRNA